MSADLAARNKTKGKHHAAYGVMVGSYSRYNARCGVRLRDVEVLPIDRLAPEDGCARCYPAGPS